MSHAEPAAGLNRFVYALVASLGIFDAPALAVEFVIGGVRETVRLG